MQIRKKDRNGLMNALRLSDLTLAGCGKTFRSPVISSAAGNLAVQIKALRDFSSPAARRNDRLGGFFRSLLVLAFAASLPSNPAAAQQATTSEDHQATATTEQEMKQGAEGILAVITQSGSTNTRGYKVVIHNDGSATAEIGGASFPGRTEPPRSQRFLPGTIDAKTLRRLLTEIGDVSRIPTGGCAKSVSFGTRTQITYEGRTSGDLQCIREQPTDGHQAPPQAAEDLGRFVQTTLGQLKINDRRFRSNE